jgi:hypothetical protein
MGSLEEIQASQKRSTPGARLQLIQQRNDRRFTLCAIKAMPERGL